MDVVTGAQSLLVAQQNPIMSYHVISFSGTVDFDHGSHFLLNMLLPNSCHTKAKSWPLPWILQKKWRFPISKTLVRWSEEQLPHDRWCSCTKTARRSQERSSGFNGHKQCFRWSGSEEYTTQVGGQVAAKVSLSLGSSIFSCVGRGRIKSALYIDYRQRSEAEGKIVSRMWRFWLTIVITYVLFNLNWLIYYYVLRCIRCT